MDFYRTLLAHQLGLKASRLRVSPLSNPVSWDAVPVTARPRRPKAGQAFFAGYIWRRKGYLLGMSPAVFLSLVGTFELSKEARAALLERWHRGLCWKPLALPIEDLEGAVKAAKPGKSDVEVAIFLLENKQPLLRVQAFHKETSAANLDSLNYMKQQGIIPRLGGKPLPLSSVAIGL